MCARHSSMRVDEGRNSWKLPAIKTEARTVAGRGEKAPAYVVNPDLSYV